MKTEKTEKIEKSEKIEKIAAAEKVEKKKESHPLQKPMMLISAAIMFSGILVAGSIVATRIFPMPSTPSLKALDAKQDPTAPSAAAPAAPQDGSISLSIGDDPVLGDKKKAKLAIVEFSDYECPFCKQFHTETFEKLKKEYVDTGKAVLVFKDFPLSFHEPMASKEAAAANCVQKLSGDSAYFDFNASVYKNTATNGKGMPDDQLSDLAVAAGVSKSKFADCVASNDFADEIAADQSEGDGVGVSGTPAFIIGTLGKDGSVTEGVKLVGAQPFDSFKKIIDAQLKK